MAASAYKHWDALLAALRYSVAIPEPEVPKYCQDLLDALAKNDGLPAAPKTAWKKLLAEQVPELILQVVAQQLRKSDTTHYVSRIALATSSAAALLRAADKAGLLHNSSGSNKFGAGALAGTFQKQLQRSGLLQQLPWFFDTVVHLLLTVTTPTSSSSGAQDVPSQDPRSKVEPQHLAATVCSVLRAWQLVSRQEEGCRLLSFDTQQACAAHSAAAACCLGGLQYATCALQQEERQHLQQPQQFLKPSHYLWQLLGDCAKQLKFSCDRLLDLMGEAHSSMLGGGSSGSSSGSSSTASLSCLCVMFMRCWAWRLPMVLLQTLLLVPADGGSSESSSGVSRPALSAATSPSRVPKAASELLMELACSREVALCGAVLESSFDANTWFEACIQEHLWKFACYQKLFSLPSFQDQLQQQQQQEPPWREEGLEEQQMRLCSMLTTVLLEWVNGLPSIIPQFMSAKLSTSAVQATDALYDYATVLRHMWQQQAKQGGARHAAGASADTTDDADGEADDDRDVSACATLAFSKGVMADNQQLLLALLPKALQWRCAAEPLLLPLPGQRLETQDSGNSAADSETGTEVNLQQELVDVYVSLLVRTTMELMQDHNQQSSQGQSGNCSSSSSNATRSVSSPTAASSSTTTCTPPVSASAAAGQCSLIRPDQVSLLLQEYVRTELAAALSTPANSSNCLRTLVSLEGLHCITMRGLLVNCSTGEPGPLLASVLATGAPGSEDAMQLFGLVCSLLKLTAALHQQQQTEAEWHTPPQFGRLQGWQQQRFAEGLERAKQSFLRNMHNVHKWCLEITALVVIAVLDSPSSAATDSSKAAGSDAAAAVLPWLVLLGRCYLQWADILQALVETGSSTHQQQQPQSQHQDAAATAEAHLTVGQLEQCIPKFTVWSSIETEARRICQYWLRDHATQLSDMGYDPQPMIQQLRQLGPATGAFFRLEYLEEIEDEAHVVAVINELLQQLRAVGLQLTSFATPHACNNPACSNVSCASEAQLVGGRGCICAGCRTARYCGRTCQRQHWKRHKPVCKAVAAVTGV